ncbi:MAG: FAD:protein FMN transferase [Coraliomargarita sp. TMED73]|nr:MAG: FAD:protein FMN transferase [Coraliomargarita sp. TMED73]
MVPNKSSMKHAQIYEHQAMNTVFTLCLLEPDPALADKSALAAIQLLDEIENKLSRYIESSDISQINHMKAGESLFISQYAYDCLRLAFDANRVTGGLFDSTLGKQIDHLKNKTEGIAPTPFGKLLIDPSRPAVHCEQAGRQIDLGGIGKGFALDCMKKCLRDWGISAALLSAGASTRLAFGDTGWDIHLEEHPNRKTVHIKEEAISASGTNRQRAHIFSPQLGTALPENQKIWLVHESAALADALSTACILMNKEEIKIFTRNYRVFSIL